MQAEYGRRGSCESCPIFRAAQKGKTIPLMAGPGQVYPAPCRLEVLQQGIGHKQESESE